MNLGIIGAGATGLTAAWDAVRAGHQVTVLEAADELGGLAASLEVGGVPLERYYHHIFRSDKAMIALIEELGLGDALRFHRPTTGIYRGGKLIDFTTPLDMLRFPEFGPVDAVRFAGSSAVLKAVRKGDRYNDLTALAWLRKWAGKKATAAIWEPLLRGKFGDRAEQVSMAWLWARIHCRTFELGYVDGGFERVYAALRDGIEDHGGKVEFGKAVRSIRQDGPEEAVVTCADGSSYAFERLIVTTPQPAFAKAAGLPDDSTLWKNQYLGATCFVLELDRSAIPYYWLNINEPDFPFLAVVEHTKMIDPSVYGGRHILYVGNYVEREDRRFTTDPGQLLDEFVPYLKRINPAFDRSWIQTWHFSKAGFAQPVVTPEYRALIPAHETPLSRVTLATMAQIYPQDRGQSYSVAMAREVTTALGLNA
ncbi:NAD(P)/FAD-dependent oxidoreductase [Streptomyces griseorubiginosus]|uniref:NAD(P)/FAD-dependent oxidoreductase n=1 Tax=Streptomyces griseorubiginosus TaxID=67304 RepID=UPI002E80E539|nr:NAD(P)/FAD-dependent oxidoreductase [Streptomyces griseorubiginosus]WUB44751.1 NAD(P)/FAD-dependent oxidoreductase [Streptomyces griseorubiginosus]WUB53268.1 NAD(P)/FAD-dependent oxidoreductase [Streptomyces griseorubiginosus]